MKITYIPRNILLICIKGYQKTLSFDHGPLKVFYPHGYCKFYPTCSQYVYDAVKRFGVIRGVFLGTKRVMRCNPCSKGGIDPVKDNK